MESIKDKFDKKYPHLKLTRELELDQQAHLIFTSSRPRVIFTGLFSMLLSTSVIFFCIKHLNISIFFSILFGVIIWFILLSLIETILIRIFGIKQNLKKINDEAIELSAKKLEEHGLSIDDLV